MNDEQAFVEKILTEPDYDYEGFVDYIYDGDIYKLWYGRIGFGSVPSALVLHRLLEMHILRKLMG